MFKKTASKPTDSGTAEKTALASGSNAMPTLSNQVGSLFGNGGSSYARPTSLFANSKVAGSESVATAAALLSEKKANATLPADPNRSSKGGF